MGNLADKLNALKTSNIQNKVNIETSLRFAGCVCDLMEDLGVSSVMQGKYVVRELRGSASTDIALYANISTSERDFFVTLDTLALSATNAVGYLHGDYSMGYQLPSFDNIVEFAVDAEAILDELLEIKLKKLEFPDLSRIKNG